MPEACNENGHCVFELGGATQHRLPARELSPIAFWPAELQIGSKSSRKLFSINSNACSYWVTVEFKSCSWDIQRAGLEVVKSQLRMHR